MRRRSACDRPAIDSDAFFVLGTALILCILVLFLIGKQAQAATDGH
ncbi:MAG TPA: hypothetical protein VFQ90_11015 [Stellaceae bacterium]|jgi:hypothetical protein|nr:hypothetical protein [Stellaceae bacterium]